MINHICPECNGTCEVNGDACKSCINAEADTVKRKAEDESENEQVNYE